MPSCGFSLKRLLHSCSHKCKSIRKHNFDKGEAINLTISRGEAAFISRVLQQFKYLLHTYFNSNRQGQFKFQTRSLRWGNSPKAQLHEQKKRENVWDHQDFKLWIRIIPKYFLSYFFLPFTCFSFG